MQDKNISELNREAKDFQEVAKDGRISWMKKRNPMTHLKPKKKKRR